MILKRGDEISRHLKKYKEDISKLKKELELLELEVKKELEEIKDFIDQNKKEKEK